MKVLMTGATGLVGKEIGKALVKHGHEIFIVSRDSQKAKLEVPYPCEVIEGDLSKGALNDPRLSSIEAVIHLAGENLSEGRWTKARKEKIMKSRSEGTKNLMASLKNVKALKTIVSTSAVGYYGDRKDEKLIETSAPGTGFLPDVCLAWEKPVNDFSNPQVRKVILRLGVVLCFHGGALMTMIKPFKFGIGSALGSGQQWVSWIHIEDLVNLFVTALENEKYSGPINAVAPHPCTNQEFSQEIGRVLHKNLMPNVPAMILKLTLGEMADVVLLSQRVEPKNALALGFRFHFDVIRKALENTLAPYKDGDSVFYAEQYVPEKREKVFPFFAAAENLEKITPPLLSFKIEKMSSPEIVKGTLIQYKLKIHGVPATWLTEIAEWDPINLFVDNQLKGPYTKWHHTHGFYDLGPGTLLTDLVRYKIPLGFLGGVAAGWFVENDVQKIFNYRRSFIANSENLQSGHIGS